jgi:hypothetical protein
MATKVTKISLSLDDAALAWAKRRAKVTKRSLSSVISDALVASRARVEAEDEREIAWKEFMARFELEQPPLTRAELDAVDEELWGPVRVKRGKTARPNAVRRKTVAARTTRKAARRAR